MPPDQLPDDLSKRINYDYQHIGSEFEESVIHTFERQNKQYTGYDLQAAVEDRLLKGDPRRYCDRVCLKMCHYLAELHYIDILKMDIEFMLDDNGRIWMFYAKKIFIRRREVEIHQPLEIKVQNTENKEEEPTEEMVQVSEKVQKIQKALHNYYISEKT